MLGAWMGGTLASKRVRRADLDYLKREESRVLMEAKMALLNFLEKQGEEGVASLATRRGQNPLELRTAVLNQVMEMAPLHASPPQSAVNTPTPTGGNVA